MCNSNKINEILDKYKKELMLISEELNPYRGVNLKFKNEYQRRKYDNLIMKQNIIQNFINELNKILKY